MPRFCVAPWMNWELSMVGNSRTCISIGLNAKDQDGEELIYGPKTLKEVWHSESFAQLRRDFIAGREPEACNSCWIKEKHGGVSNRLHQIQWYKDNCSDNIHELAELGPYPETLPRMYGLHAGNICSLRCRMCGPVKSSSFRSDKVATSWSDRADPSRKALRDKSDKYKREAWWRDSKHVDALVDSLPDSGPMRLLITGGEPFLSPYSQRLLEKLAERPNTHETILQVYTNGQQIPDNLEVLERFKLTKIMLSTEAHGPLGEYIRHRSKWNKTLAFLEAASKLKNTQINLSASLQIYNMLALDDLALWGFSRGWQVNISHIVSPYYLDAVGAPQALREEAAARLDAAATQVDGFTARCLRTASSRLRNPQPGINRQVRMDRFTRFTRELDLARNESLEEVAPELADKLDYRRAVEMLAETTASRTLVKAVDM